MPNLDEQLAILFRNLAEEQQVMVTPLSVQQQKGGSDSGAFAIASAFNTARGDDTHSLLLNQENLQNHIVKCFKQKMF